VTMGASAGTLKRRDSSDLLDPGWGGKDGYYRKADGLYCQKCPAEECKEQNTSGRCEPCRPGEYMEYPNAFRWCQDCLECREDQVQRSSCQPHRNTVCACKDGTFCPPDHPCEMCQRCRPRCPEGQEELKPCTPDSDLQCGPAKGNGYIYFVIVIPLAIVILSAFCYWKRCHNSPGGCSGPPELCTGVGWVGRETLGAPSWCGLGGKRGPGSTQLVWAGSDTVIPGVTLSFQVTQPSGRPKRNLVPRPGSDPTQALRGSFYTFAGKVPRDHWKKFGRSLDLEENNVVTATSEDGFYEMLLKWQNKEGSKSSVNTLLETLDRLHLSGVADDISSMLVQNGHFQDETS
ncbi:TR10B factor, partial [Thryothorus ludovicianus]|nr:TR10B factor [Thryothorus ludovicianus]